MEGERMCAFAEKAVNEIKKTFENCYDFQIRALNAGGKGKFPAHIFFIDGLVSGVDLSENVIRPMTDWIRFERVDDIREFVRMITGGVVYNHTVRMRMNADEAIDDLLSGFCGVIFDQYPAILTFETRSADKRGIDQPKEEKVEKGAKDTFIEILKTNTMLIRRRIKDKNLKIEQVVLGEKTNTAVAMVYIDGYTNPEIVSKVRERLGNIKSEGILSTSDIEENIADAPKSVFPQLLTTERPDKFCLNIIEGRVGIIADGLPVGILAPGTFSQFFKVPEDKAHHYVIVTLLTMLRYAALLMSLLLPAFYVAIAMYHQEMIPTKLLQSIIDSKQSVPFPTAIEVILMLLSFELLQEAGLRLPNPVGETVSIIGALIVGQSAVEAQIVSPVVIIVVAFAGIAGYTMPNQDMSAALRICRFILVIAAILAGMFGLAIVSCLIIYHLCTLSTFGVPYMDPFAGSDARNIIKALSREPVMERQEKDETLFFGGDEK